MKAKRPEQAVPLDVLTQAYETLRSSMDDAAATLDVRIRCAEAAGRLGFYVKLLKPVEAA